MIDSKTVEYGVWHDMKSRCINPNIKQYKHYGGRGITVCKAWANSFKSFLDDMGRRPSNKHSLDRKNNDGNYEPGNCRWATQSCQARNKRNNLMGTHPVTGETKCATDWSRLLGGDDRLVNMRVRRYGWTIEKAITTPARQYTGSY